MNGQLEVPKSMALGKLFSEYRDNLPIDSLEPETLRVARIHMDHIERTLGVRFAIERLAQQHLQDYVLQRSKEKGKRGKRLSATTIKKEISTFSTVWSWAVTKGYATVSFRTRTSGFPKRRKSRRFRLGAKSNGRLDLAD